MTCCDRSVANRYSDRYTAATAYLGEGTAQDRANFYGMVRGALVLDCRRVSRGTADGAHDGGDGAAIHVGNTAIQTPAIDALHAAATV